MKYSLWNGIDCSLAFLWNGVDYSLWMLECQGVLTGVFMASSCRYGDGLESSPGMSRYGGGLVLDET